MKYRPLSPQDSVKLEQSLRKKAKRPDLPEAQGEKALRAAHNLNAVRRMKAKKRA